MFKNQQGFTVIEGILIILLMVAIGTAGYFTHQARQDKIDYSVQAPKKTTKQQESNNYEGWQTFKSKAEGFSLKYPGDWKVSDTSSGNCAHTMLNGSDCRERFEFTSPDGTLARFVIHRDDNDDKISCGKQSVCSAEVVKRIETLRNVGRLGDVLVVYKDKSDYSLPQVELDRPLGSDTTPKVGVNQYSDHFIDYSLPSALGGRFTLYVTSSDGVTSQRSMLSYDDYMNLKSVQEGVKLLKSISY
jgi:hypothetical protein